MKRIIFPEQSLQSLQTYSFQLQQQQEGASADPNTPVKPGEPGDDQKEKIKTPFDEIDLDLLDTNARAAIVKAKEHFATNAKAIESAATDKARAELLQAEVDKIKATANSHSQQQQQQKQSSLQGEPTFEDEVRAQLKAAGITDPNVLEANVKLQLGMFDKFGERVGNTLGKVLEPIQRNNNETTATQIFTDLRQTNSRLQIDEVANDVWAKVDKMVQAGHTPTAEIIANFAKIAHADYLDSNPNSPNLKQQPPPVIQQRQNTATRYTFPGAGHNPQVRPTGVVDDIGGLDAETAAAIGMTKQEWANRGVKVPGVKGGGAGLKITRG